MFGVVEGERHLMTCLLTYKGGENPVYPRCEKWLGGQHDGALSLHPQKRTFSHCTGGWVGPGTGLSLHKISYYTGIRSPDRQLIASRRTTYASRTVLLGMDEQ